MNTQKIKVAAVGGFGHFADVFEEFADMVEVNLVAYAPAFAGEEIEVVRNHRFCNEAKYYQTSNEMLAKERPDLVIISTRLDHIAPAVIEAAGFGCHLIVEKPLAIDINVLHKVFAAVTQNKVRLAAMLSMRSLPAFVKAREIYQTGDIGRIILANVRKSYRWGQRAAWYNDRSKYGGTIPWIGIHAFDILNFITGEKYLNVYAMQSNLNHPTHPECEDNCVVLTELSNGAHVTISIDYCRPDEALLHGDDYVRIVGSKGIIESNASKNVYSVLKAGKEEMLSAPSKSVTLYRDFIQGLLSGRLSELEKANPFMLTNVCLCARKSSYLKQPIKIENQWERNNGY